MLLRTILPGLTIAWLAAACASNGQGAPARAGAAQAADAQHPAGTEHPASTGQPQPAIRSASRHRDHSHADWLARQLGKDLLTRLDGLVELEQLCVRAQPDGFDDTVVAFRTRQARRWTADLRRIASAMPATTDSFVPELCDYVQANAERTRGPAVLAEGFASRMARARIAFCDGFVDVRHPDDIFLKTWQRMRWASALFESNPHGVPQDLLLTGYWEAHEQWLHEFESQPYEDFRHWFAHLVEDALRAPMPGDDPRMQTFAKVVRLRHHFRNGFREPAPLTEQWTTLLETVRDLEQDASPRTALAGTESWWSVTRGLALVWQREADPLRRELLAGFHEACLDACRELSPPSLHVPDGIVHGARNWPRILRKAAELAREIDDRRGSPTPGLLRQIRTLAAQSEEFGIAGQHLLHFVARPVRRQLQREARALVEQGCPALAIVQWLEAEMLTATETSWRRDATTELGDLGRILASHLPDVDTEGANHQAFASFVTTQLIGRSRLDRHYGIRLQPRSAETAGNMRLCLRNREEPHWSHRKDWLLGPDKGKLVAAPQVVAESLSSAQDDLRQAEDDARLASRSLTATPDEVQRAFAQLERAIEHYHAVHGPTLVELRDVFGPWIEAPTRRHIERDLAASKLPPRERDVRRWLLGLDDLAPQQVARRAMHPETLAQLVRDVSDAREAARLLTEQLRLRRERTSGQLLPAHYHVQRLGPAWAEYAVLYGHETLRRELLTPLFGDDEAAVRHVVAAVPFPRREVLRLQLGLPSAPETPR